jgi:hypothetical protein
MSEITSCPSCQVVATIREAANDIDIYLSYGEKTSIQKSLLQVRRMLTETIDKIDPMDREYDPSYCQFHSF